MAKDVERKFGIEITPVYTEENGAIRRKGNVYTLEDAYRLNKVMLVSSEQETVVIAVHGNDDIEANIYRLDEVRVESDSYIVEHEGGCVSCGAGISQVISKDKVTTISCERCGVANGATCTQRREPAPLAILDDPQKETYHSDADIVWEDTKQGSCLGFVLNTNPDPVSPLVSHRLRELGTTEVKLWRFREKSRDQINKELCISFEQAVIDEEIEDEEEEPSEDIVESSSDLIRVQEGLKLEPTNLGDEMTILKIYDPENGNSMEAYLLYDTYSGDAIELIIPEPYLDTGWSVVATEDPDDSSMVYEDLHSMLWSSNAYSRDKSGEVYFKEGSVFAPTHLEYRQENGIIPRWAAVLKSYGHTLENIRCVNIDLRDWDSWAECIEIQRSV